MTGAVFDDVLGETTALLEYANGHTSEMHVSRWVRDADPVDSVLVNRCLGATLDVGCGPGRLTSALTNRGIRVLGIDTSATAVRMTRRRGSPAAQHNVFDPVPHQGHWQHALLADGNVGIGGDPVRLLRRVAALVQPGGSTLVEVGPPGTGLHRGHARLARGPWFPWAEVDTDSLVRLARRMHLAVLWTAHRQGRWFVELGHPISPLTPYPGEEAPAC